MTGTTAHDDYMAAIQAAQAGTCSHGGHDWDGDTCTDIPALTGQDTRS